ncbi:LytTR family DNA-binding domain-containing protein [Alkalimonas collagenimarina]|uniref:LytTR family DNA-binding domain-containing protein n=1 Tax=Alkalimonas collagenimarina TaxID=400390 RepID=A0ABT9GVN7_9GAMM|nr:LytTR family DNA-binding domain-containing protein [Alkalimonas collagenimarina]MDP4535114.1 LytTR family DNA-binding domain-containing protein [Alkalimonas collagenimarina]
MQEEIAMLKAYIVDDEKPAIMKLERQLSPLDSVEVIGSSQSPTQAIKEINKLQPDLVFLDINMAELSGFDIIPFLPVKTQIVFTTASEKHAIQAFEKSAVDYLLKPFDTDRLLKAIVKVEHAISASGDIDNRKEIAPEYNQDILVSKQGDRIFFVKLADIYYFKSMQGTVYGHTVNKAYPFSTSLEKLEAELNPQNFIRFHRSFLINVHHIKEVQRWFGGKLLVIMSDSNLTEISSSRDGAKVLKRQFNL